jgi:hydroxymethylpyrimidine pyrophosphatase-like HAD family hydrolase
LRFSVLALDYDGTIARDGVLDGHVKDAIREARDRGIAVILVTGRILSDLQRVTGDLHFVDAAVAENGAVLAFPNGHSWLIGRPPAPELVDELRRRGIAFTAGQCLLETDAALAPQILAVIRELELPYVLLFNRGRVMVLPQAISKATGLRYALTALRLSAHNAIAIGDAENDHDLLAACEIGVAVGWGSPALQRSAHEVIHGDGPADLAPYIRYICSTMQLPPDRVGRNKIMMGTTDRGAPLVFPIRNQNVLITGDPRSGKSWAAGVFCEQLMLHDYCTCVIDPEGDYEQLEALPRVATWRGVDPLPPLPDLARLLRHPDVSVVISMSHTPYKEKVEYLMTLLPMLASLRRRTGLPHRIVIDEAHYFLHEANVKEMLDLELGSYTLVTCRASDLNLDVRKAMEIVCATRIAAPQEAQAMQTMFGGGAADWSATLASLKDGEAVLLSSPPEAGGKLQRFSFLPRLTAHVRHRSKYFDVPIPPGREFAFTRDGNPVGPPCRTLKDFVAALGGMPDAVLDGHARRGDFSRWFQDVFHDYPLASDLRKLEQRYRLGYVASLSGEAAGAIRARYEIEPELVL